YNYQDSATDAGLLFLSYQRDPAQFTRIQASLAASDALNRFSTVLGSGLWAVPPGAASGGWLAEGLLGS
ncbi:MAG: Dyp-type peroxidase, partial [Dehalococcoidia bacterium]|nr:Dyp-type peroxidase [Dehalococcoidia bacterium]